MATKKKKKSVAEQIIDGTYQGALSLSDEPVSEQIIKGTYKAGYDDTFVNTNDDPSPLANVINSTSNKEKEEPKWWQEILQVPDAFNDNLDRFKDGYQFGDITKTVGETVGDTVGTVAGSVADLGLGVIKGVAQTGENLASLAAGGIAQVADWTGNDKFADNLRKEIATSKPPASTWLGQGQDLVDNFSIFGDTGDKTSESVGYMASLWASGGLGKIGQTATMFGSAAGSTLPQSYSKEGVTDAQVWGKALGTGAIETVTERLFGLFGTSGIDKTIANKVSKKITSGAGKILARSGVAATGEAFEEFLSYTGSQGLDSAIDAISNGKGAEFKEDWNWEEVGEQMAIAFLATGALGAGGVGTSVVGNKTNTNTWSDAVNETAKQQDIQALQEDITNLNEKLNKEGKNTVTGKKLQLQINERQAELNKLTATDNTAQVQGLQEAIVKKQEELNNAQDPREQQIIQEELNILNEELTEVTNAQQFTNTEQNVDNNELKRQNFVYEENENDSDIKKNLYKSASNYVNNTKESHAFVDLVAKIAEERNTAYEFVDSETLKQLGHSAGKNIINGLVTDEGKVLINIESKKALETVVGHETTHLLEGTKEYKALQDYVIEYAKQKGIYEEAYRRLEGLYEGKNADINAELTADLVGDLLFSDTNFVRELSVQHRNVFEKFYDYIKHLYKMATAGSKEARQLEQLKHKFEEAYKAEGTKVKGETQLSVSDIKINNISDIKNKYKDVTKYLILNENENSISINNMVVKEELRNQGIGQNILDDIVEYANKNNKTITLTPTTEFNTKSKLTKWYKTNGFVENKGRNTNFEIRDTMYKLPESNIDTKYSISTDNQGRELTKEQQEFFKDSKVRDENGNLLTVYHGTKNEFYEFTDKYMGKGQGNALGNGYYFTADEREADYYSRVANVGENGRTLKTYLNIKNPLVLRDIDENTFTNKIDEMVQIINPSIDTKDEFYKDYTKPYIERKFETSIGFVDYIKGIAQQRGIEASEIYKALGYDGIIDGNQYVVFDSNQIKNIDNTKPTTDPDIRYSLSEDTEGRKLSKEQIERYKYVSDKLKDENGRLKPYYHGTQRADRVGTYFDPERATSGPMAFFTDSKEIGQNYSENKSDTSLSREYDTEYDLFKADGKDLDTYWNSLSRAEQQKINREGNNVGLDDDWENIVYGDRASENSFSDMYKWYLNNETNGNGIKALYNVWVQDGNIMGDDLYKFQEVLEKAGLKNVEFLDPYKVDSKVYEVYLNITNPFDTSDISEDIVQQFKEASKTATIGEQYSADAWDKTNITPEQWINKLESDIAENTTHAWTVIPDWVTSVLKKNGYDGIVDTGGKGGGVGHQVVIPFYSEQIKDVSNQQPTDNPNIDMSLSSENEIAPVKNPNLTYGEDIKYQVEEAIAPLQETIENLTEQVKAMQENIVPTAEQYTQPTTEEIKNLMDIKEKQSGSEYARAFYALRDKYGQENLYKSLNEYYSTGTVTQPNNDIDTAPTNQEVIEQQGQEAFDNIADTDAPPKIDVSNMSWEEAMLEDSMLNPISDYEETAETKVKSPFDSRDIDEVGNRKVKAYQYENPEVRPYFRNEAENMMWDLNNTIKGERSFNDQLYYDSGGEQGFFGTTRQTTEAIAYLKDNYGYSYAQIEKGLNDIIEDNGKENNAVAKRIEFMLDERLREGYTTSDGIPIPPNQEYIKFLEEKQITEYNRANLESLAIDENVPVEENTVVEQPETAVEPTNIQTEQITPPPTNIAQNGNTEVTEVKQRKWVETSTESEVVNRQILPDDLDQSKIFYQPITNRDTLNKANKKLNSLGYEEALKHFNSQIANKNVSVQDIVLGERLIQEALRNNDTKTAGELIQNVAILGTELGQKVQALSIIQRMTPEGQLKMLEKIVNRGVVKEDKAFEGVQLTQEMKDKILNTYNEDGSYDQDALNKAVEEVKQEIADQMEVTAMDKANAWRYLAMLGNPKTHIRNLVSNAAMRVVLESKNAVARTIETVAPIQDRTKTWKQASPEVHDFVEHTTIEMKDVIGDNSKYSEEADLKAKRDVFKSRILQKAYDFNSDLLQKEDWWFSKPVFKKSLQEFLTANGISTKEDIQNHPELVEKGKQYAVEQAQIATFRQYSWLANKISSLERKNAATNIAVGSIIPFKKTPINIAKAGLNYSPIGALKSLTYDLHKVKKGEMEASKAIDNIAQGATGTALTLIGYMLAQAGLLNGGGEDDKEGKYDYQLGKQAYSINFGDSTYSLSWLSPVAMPLFVGANAYEKLVEGEEISGDVALEALAQTLDPLSEMSFMSSLDSVLSSYDSGVEKFAGIGETMIQSFATQFVPTLSSQIASTLDDTKRTTKVSGDSNMKMLEEVYNKLIYKIPFLRETLEPTTDIWGNEVKQTENLFSRAYESFISPYARKENIATEIDEELKELFSQTGDNGLIPNIPYNYVNFGGEKYNMSAKEYTEFKETYGQTANDLLEDLFKTTTYQGSTAEEKTDMVNDVFDYARDKAKYDYLAKEDVDYTNATKDGVDIYKENYIKAAIENDMTVDEYKLFEEKPDKYNFFKNNNISFDEYESNKDVYNYAYENQDKYVVSKAITDNFATYYSYIQDINDFDAKDESGETVSGLKKERVFDYINSLEMNIPQKVMMFKMQYPKDKDYVGNDYNYDILDYVKELDTSYEEKVSILRNIGIEVDDNGDVYW